MSGRYRTVLRQAERLAKRVPGTLEGGLLQALALLRGGRPAGRGRGRAGEVAAGRGRGPPRGVSAGPLCERLGRADDRRAWSRQAGQATARVNPDWARRITLRELARR